VRVLTGLAGIEECVDKNAFVTNTLQKLSVGSQKYSQRTGMVMVGPGMPGNRFVRGLAHCRRGQGCRRNSQPIVVGLSVGLMPQALKLAETDVKLTRT
jgi:hypothetical protein